ncbi:DNA (cytosine-5-)-methyltransferase [Gottfriedia acidiceleris]|uniref:DNA (cytosine-5-)-methyltransferase n=1 Tax=Gottfriedia acidiceleris TaxID=371036 RepID=UPI003000615D
MKVMNVVELFAGVGGFRVGLEKASKDFNVIWGNQWEPSRKSQDAYECYSKQFKGQGIHSNKDISKVDFGEIPDEFQLLVGGFPCQDYSVARSLSGEKGIQGKKGVLFWEIKRFINHFKPKYVLLENVDRLLKSPSKQRGRDFAIMLATFRDEGYNVEWRVINAADYGFVQRRRRVFIFAYKMNEKFDSLMQNFNGSTQIHETGFFATEFPVAAEKYEKKKSFNFPLIDDIVDISDNFSKTFLKAGRMVEGIVDTFEVIPVEDDQISLGSILETDITKIDNKFFLSDYQKEKIKSMKDAKKIERTTADGFTYTFSEGGMSCPDDELKPARTMLTSEGTINRSTHVVFHPGTDKWRFLTPEECEQLNGFEKGWTSNMTDRMRYFCMGNALVVGLIEKMGNRILEIESKEVVIQEALQLFE